MTSNTKYHLYVLIAYLNLHVHMDTFFNISTTATFERSTDTDSIDRIYAILWYVVEESSPHFAEEHLYEYP